MRPPIKLEYEESDTVLSAERRAELLGPWMARPLDMDVVVLYKTYPSLRADLKAMVRRAGSILYQHRYAKTTATTRPVETKSWPSSESQSSAAHAPSVTTSPAISSFQHDNHPRLLASVIVRMPQKNDRGEHVYYAVDSGSILLNSGSDPVTPLSVKTMLHNINAFEDKDDEDDDESDRYTVARPLLTPSDPASSQYLWTVS